MGYVLFGMLIMTSRAQCALDKLNDPAPIVQGERVGRGSGSRHHISVYWLYQSGIATCCVLRRSDKIDGIRNSGFINAGFFVVFRE
jgi:hypothetical protein